MSWLVPRDELTAEQIRAVEMSRREPCVVLGAPGSGKTQILLHRAKYLLEEDGGAEHRFHIFVFTNVLKQYIRSALVDLGLAEDAVSTIDDWCVQYYRRKVSSRLPWDKENRCHDYAAVRKSVREALRDQILFDVVLVDEGQDLDADTFLMLKSFSHHITVAMDNKQQIYPEGSGEAQVMRSLGLRRRNVTLLDAFRCCPYIVRVAAELIENESERRAYLNQTRTAQTEIQTPLLYEAGSFEEERDRLIEVIRERQLIDRSIGILFPLNRQVEGFAQGLRDNGIPVETRKSGLDFSTSRPKVLTIHSAKGLTFDSVMVPRVVSASFKGRLDGWAERLLYVAITRGTKWLYLSTIKEKEVPALTKIRALAKIHPPVVTIASGNGKPTEPTRCSTEETEDVLDLL